MIAPSDADAVFYTIFITLQHGRFVIRAMQSDNGSVEGLCHSGTCSRKELTHFVLSTRPPPNISQVVMVTIT